MSLAVPCAQKIYVQTRYLTSSGEQGLAFFLFEKGRKQKKNPQTPYAPFIFIGLASLRARRVACVRDPASSIDSPCICPRCKKQPPRPGHILKDQPLVAAAKDDDL